MLLPQVLASARRIYRLAGRTARWARRRRGLPRQPTAQTVVRSNRFTWSESWSAVEPPSRLTWRGKDDTPVQSDPAPSEQD